MNQPLQDNSQRQYILATAHCTKRLTGRERDETRAPLSGPFFPCRSRDLWTTSCSEESVGCRVEFWIQLIDPRHKSKGRKYTTCLLLTEHTFCAAMLKDKKTKVKITFLVIVVGISSMLAAVVTDHWAVLSPRVEKLNTTCEAAHFGLWKLCKKSIFIVEEDPQGKGCGPISLPGGKGEHVAFIEPRTSFQALTNSTCTAFDYGESVNVLVEELLDSLFDVN